MFNFKDFRSMRQLLGASRGNKQEAIENYLSEHPDADQDKVRRHFDIIESKRNLSVLQLSAAGAKFTDDYTDDDAVREYVEMHPDTTEAEAWAELKRLQDRSEETLRGLQERYEREKDKR